MIDGFHDRTEDFEKHGWPVQVLVSPEIEAWFIKGEGKAVWDAAGICHDLSVMSSMARWKGIRRIGGTNFTDPPIMDRLERLQDTLPDGAILFTGTFPRSKGQQKKQILWMAERRDRARGVAVILIGVESEINLIPDHLMVDCG
jgi:hypothetical protein